MVNMSDQYTRITCGGSPLPTNAPVLGLLFGVASTTHAATGASVPNSAIARSTPASTTTPTPTPTTLLEIVDAEDIPVDRSEAALLQEELHQAVFPQHRVVGWYRVSDHDDDILPSDVVLTQQLEQHYYSQGRGGGSSGPGSSTTNPPFVFALMVLNPTMAPTRQALTDTNDSKPPAAADDPTTTVPGSTMDDAPLPLTLYRLLRDDNDGGGSVGATLRALEEWTLETGDSERISVERILREPPPQQSSRPTTTDSVAPAGEPGAATATSSTTVDPTQVAADPPFVQHTLALEHSLQAIQDRLAVLHEFLQDTVQGTIPFHPSLMRRVHALLLQLGPIAGQAPPGLGNPPPSEPLSSSNSSTTTTAAANPKAPDRLLIPVAQLAQAVEAIQSYTDKFRLVHEGSTGGASAALQHQQQAPGTGAALSPRLRGEVRQL